MGDLAELARSVLADGADVERLKRTFAEQHGLDSIPSNADIISAAPDDIRDFVARIIRKKPQRTISGVAPVAVMTSPSPCPHGTCSFCPGGVDNDTPQSYTGREPAALRAAQHDYDPFRQVKARLAQYTAGGHPTDKIDLIVMGGTFTARESEYQGSFIKGCLDALNGRVSPNLADALDANASAVHRAIGITFETRPDLFTGGRVDNAVALGATRVEFGVQSLRDGVLDDVGRGHSVDHTVAATRDAKEAGLKVLYQMMPGLPGSTPSSDLEDFERLFTDPSLMPDMLKIYPTLVIPGTRLHDRYEDGGYEPLDDATAARLVADMKALVPPWVRIQRVQRDIPAQLIAAGVRKGNLRQIAQGILAEEGRRCRCIRCSEAGRVDDISADDRDPPALQRIEYEASGGRESFLSYRSGDTLHAYLRLRLGDSGPARVRELRVVGELVPLGLRDRGIQHRGLGASLLSEAERIAGDVGRSQVAVTSGVGVRDYYAGKGYSLDGMYMVKEI